MRKLLFLILFLPLFGWSQDYSDLLPDIAWHTLIENVVYLGEDTFQVDVAPIDLQEPGAFPRQYGNFLMDIRGFRYKIISSTATSVTVEDIFDVNYAPFQNALGAIYQSAGVDSLNTIPTIIFDRLGFKALSYGYRIDMKTLSSKIDAALINPVDSILFTEQNPGDVTTEKNLYASSETRGLEYIIDQYGSVTLGAELWDYYANLSGQTLVDGDVVSIVGATGNRLAMDLTDATNDQSATACIGMVTVPSINNNQVGRITKKGRVGSLNTSSFTEGLPVYVDPLNDGKLIQSPVPEAPDNFIHIGIVVISHATEGVIDVDIRVSPSVKSLSDVNGTPLTENGQIMVWNNDSSYFDFDVNLNNYVNDSIFDNITGAFRLYGGIITDNGDGSVSIGSGAGIIKNTEAGPEDVPTAINDGQGGKLHYVSWDSVSSLSLIDDAYNYIYLDGTDSTIKSTTNFYSISFTKDFTLGRAYRDGTDVIARLCGTNAWNFNRRVQLFGEEVFPVIRGGNGLIIAAAGTLQFTITEGILWAELVNRFTVGAYDGTTTNFNYWYRDGVGGWTKTSASAIDNQNYDNNSGTLQALTAQRYGVHWVYEDHAGDVHVIYGQGNYTENEAQTAPIPNPRPGIVTAYSTIIGKIVVQKGQTTFYSIQSAFTDVFDLLNLPDGLTSVSTDSTLLGDGTVTDPLSVDATKFNLSDFNDDLTTYVPYTGATANVDIGTYDFDADNGNFDGTVVADNTRWNDLGDRSGSLTVVTGDKNLEFTLTGDFSLTLTSASSSGGWLFCHQDATGGHSFTLFGSTLVGEIPSINSSANTTTIIKWWEDDSGLKFHTIIPYSSGGTSDHSLLTNLDYASAGHTGFAGTGVSNTFTASQTFNETITSDKDVIHDGGRWNYLGNRSGSLTVTNGDKNLDWTLTGDWTLTLSVANATWGWMVCRQDATGGHSFTLFGATLVGDISAINSAANSTTIMRWWEDESGIKYYTIFPYSSGGSVDYINAASFNTGDGVLTLSGVGSAGATVDLDGRYARLASSNLFTSFNTFNGYIWTKQYLLTTEQSSVSTPGAGIGAWYFKTDGKPYAKNDVGTEYDLSASGGGVSFGSASQIPYTNATTDDFSYSSSFSYDESIIPTMSIGTSGELTEFTVTLNDIVAPGTVASGTGEYWASSDFDKPYFTNDSQVNFDLTGLTMPLQTVGSTGPGYHQILSTDYTVIWQTGNFAARFEASPSNGRVLRLVNRSTTNSVSLQTSTGSTLTVFTINGGSTTTLATNTSIKVQYELSTGFWYQID